jgi:Flp pilus assembly CpaF family ATPase
MKIPIPIQNAFNDVTVNDLCINGQNEAFLDRGSGLEPIHFLESDTNKNQDWLRDWVLELLSSVGKSWDAKHPFVDARYQVDIGCMSHFPR